MGSQWRCAFDFDEPSFICPIRYARGVCDFVDRLCPQGLSVAAFNPPVGDALGGLWGGNRRPRALLGP